MKINEKISISHSIDNKTNRYYENDIYFTSCEDLIILRSFFLVASDLFIRRLTRTGETTKGQYKGKNNQASQNIRNSTFFAVTLIISKEERHISKFVIIFYNPYYVHYVN